MKQTRWFSVMLALLLMIGGGSVWANGTMTGPSGEKSMGMSHAMHKAHAPSAKPDTCCQQPALCHCVERDHQCDVDCAHGQCGISHTLFVAGEWELLTIREEAFFVAFSEHLTTRFISPLTPPPLA